MEGKKSKRGKGSSTGSHGRLTAKKKKTAEVMNEKERLERLEAASVLSSLKFSVPAPKHPQAKVRRTSDSNGVIEATQSAVTYISTAPSTGIPTSHAPSSVQSSIHNGTQLAPRGSGTSIASSVASNTHNNSMILAHLQSQINIALNRQTMPSQRISQFINPQTILQLQNARHAKRHNASLSAPAPGVPSVVLNAEPSKLPLTLNPTQTINKSVASALRQAVSGGGNKKQTLVAVDLPSSMDIDSMGKGSIKLEKLSSADIKSEKLESDALNSGRKKDSSDNNLPLKKRRLVAQGTPNSAENALTFTSTFSSLPSARIASLTSAAHIENILQMARDYPGPVARDYPGPESQTQSLISGSYIEEKLPPGEGYRPMQFDPRTSLLVLSDVKVALTPDEDGDLPIHIAVVHENTELVKKFIDIMAMSGKSLDRYNKLQQTPLHLAVLVNKPDIMAALLSAGANPNLMDRNGCTSVHIAINKQFHRCLETVYTYSQCKFETNTRNYEGYPPLHTCVELNDIKSMEFLIKHGADYNIQDGKAGRSVVFYATEYNRTDMVDFLISSGANAELLNYAGISPFMTAVAAKLNDIIAILQKAIDVSKLYEDPQYPLSRKMAIPRIPSKSSMIVSDTLIRSRSNSFSKDSRPLSRQSSRSSNQSPIDLSFNRNTDSPSEFSVLDLYGKIKGIKDEKSASNSLKEKHTQLIAALEGKNMLNRKYMSNSTDKPIDDKSHVETNFKQEVLSELTVINPSDEDFNVNVENRYEHMSEKGGIATINASSGKVNNWVSDEEVEEDTVDQKDTSGEQPVEDTESDMEDNAELDMESMKTTDQNDRMVTDADADIVAVSDEDTSYKVDTQMNIGTETVITDIADIGMQGDTDADTEINLSIEESAEQMKSSLITDFVSEKENEDSIKAVVSGSGNNTPPELLENEDDGVDEDADRGNLDQDYYKEEGENNSPKMPVLSRAISMTTESDSNYTSNSEAVDVDKDKTPEEEDILEPELQTERESTSLKLFRQTSENSRHSSTSQGFEAIVSPDQKSHETETATEQSEHSNDSMEVENSVVASAIKDTDTNAEERTNIAVSKDAHVNDTSDESCAEKSRTKTSESDVCKESDLVESKESGVFVDSDEEDRDIPLVIDENIDDNINENGEKVVTDEIVDGDLIHNAIEVIDRSSVTGKEDRNVRNENLAHKQENDCKENSMIKMKNTETLDDESESTEDTGKKKEMDKDRDADNNKISTNTVDGISLNSQTMSGTTKTISNGTESRARLENGVTKLTTDSQVKTSEIPTCDDDTDTPVTNTKSDKEIGLKTNHKAKGVIVSENISKASESINDQSADPTLATPLSAIDELKSGHSHTLYFHDGVEYKPVKIFIDNSKQSSLVLQQMLQASLANMPAELLNMKDSSKTGSVKNMETHIKSNQIPLDDVSSSEKNSLDEKNNKPISNFAPSSNHISATTVSSTPATHTEARKYSVVHDGGIPNKTESSLTDIEGRPAKTTSVVRDMLSRPRIESPVSNILSRPTNSSIISVSKRQPFTNASVSVGSLKHPSTLRDSDYNSVSKQQHILQQEVIVNLKNKNVGQSVHSHVIGSLSKGTVMGKSRKGNSTLVDPNALNVTENEQVDASPMRDVAKPLDNRGKELNKNTVVILDGSLKPAPHPNFEKFTASVQDSSSANRNIPNLTLMTTRKFSATVGPFAKTSGFATGRNPITMTEGTLTRVNPDIKSRLSKALQSPQRKLNQNRPLNPDTDSRYPNIQGIGGHLGEIGSEVISTKSVVDPRQQL